MITDEQKAAINWGEGPMVLSAGAGSGKTHCAVERYRRLILSGVPARKILMITFTNKAATEMKIRTLKAVPNLQSSDLHIFTFHGLCNYWLRRRGEAIGLSQYTILDDSETQSMVWSVARKHSIYGSTTDDKSLEEENKTMKKRKVELLSSVLNKLDTNYDMTVPQACDKLGIYSGARKFCISALSELQTNLMKQSLLTFANLHSQGITLFKTDPSIAHSYEYFMADEAQDSNPGNMELLKTLVHNGNIVCYLDAKQSIYGFRGSSANASRELIDHFNATELFLTKNFRSTTKIVALANDSVKRSEEKMAASTSNPGQVAYMEYATEDLETEAIIKFLIACKEREDRK